MKREMQVKYEKGEFYDDKATRHEYQTIYLIVDGFMKIKLADGENLKNLKNMIKNGDQIHVADTILQK